MAMEGDTRCEGQTETKRGEDCDPPGTSDTSALMRLQRVVQRRMARRSRPSRL